MSRHRTIFPIVTTAFLLAAALPCTAQTARGSSELGAMAFRAGEFELALEHFEKALAIEPGNPSARRNVCATHQAMANALAEGGDFEAAAARVEQGIAVDPGNAAALAQAGSYYLALGTLAKAEENLQAALKAMPENREAQFLMGETYYRLNKLEEARTVWSELLAAEPDWPALQEKYDKLTREAGVEGTFEAHEGEHFHVSYGKVLSDELRDTVLAILEEAYQSIGERLGGLYPKDTVQVVLYEGKDFATATETKAHVGALFDGKIRAPVTSREGRFLTRRVLETRLTHEYVHVVLAAHLGPKAPWWLNEGLAETLSREMDRRRQRMLGTAYRGEMATPLVALERVDLEGADAEALALSYAQAHATVDLLWKKGGAESMTKFLAALRADATPEKALQSAYALDYAGLEAALAVAYP